MGNLRFAFRDHGARTQQRTASMEPANANKEEKEFSHVPETRQFDAKHARMGNYVARLSAAEGRREGPSITLVVHAADSVKAEVYGRYDHGAVIANAMQRGGLVAGAMVGGNPGLMRQDNAQPQASRPRWRPYLGVGLGIIPQLLKHPKQEVPQAFLRYELFTQDSQLVATRIQPLQRTATDEWQHLEAGIKADSAGYVKVSLVNESKTPAYFDDLALRPIDPNEYQENHYDPWGQNLVGIEDLGNPDSKFQFNGKEKQEDFGLGWTDYGARMYDSQLGRWHAVDPLAHMYWSFSNYNYVLNNPINLIDPDGRSIWDVNDTRANITYKGKNVTISNFDELDAAFREVLLNTILYSDTGAEEIKQLAEDGSDYQIVVSDKAGFIEGEKKGNYGSNSGQTVFDPKPKGKQAYASVTYLFDTTKDPSTAMKDPNSFDFVKPNGQLATLQERTDLGAMNRNENSIDKGTNTAMSKLSDDQKKIVDKISKAASVDRGFGYITTLVHELNHAFYGKDELKPYLQEIKSYQETHPGTYKVAH